MSVGATASPSRAFATQVTGGVRAAPELDGETTAGQALPRTLTDARGRVFDLQQDPISEHSQYRHVAEQRDGGSLLELEILIDLSPDGSFTRRTAQSLMLANGDGQRETVFASYDARGIQVGETTDSARREGETSLTEKTTGIYVAGVLVKRETDLVRVEAQTDPITAERTTSEAKVHGTWDEGGLPISDATVPIVDRAEKQVIHSPGQGINKDTDRSLTFTRHGAGPLDAIDWDETGNVLVRFEGRNGQYMERELSVPLSAADGAPDMANATELRSEDRQNAVNKGLTQARVWGGLVSNLTLVAGANFLRGGLGKGVLGVSAAAAGAQLIGEGHAIATKRNDGSWSRLATSAYDMVLTGMVVALRGGRGNLTQPSASSRLGLSALGGAGIANNGSELLGNANPIGSDALTSRLGDVSIGRDLLPRSTSRLDSPWRLEPRFDAGAALAG